MSKINRYMVNLLKEVKRKELGDSYYTTTWIPKIDEMIKQFNSNEDPNMIDVSLLKNIKAQLGNCSDLIIGKKTNNVLVVLPTHYNSDKKYIDKLHDALNELKPDCKIWYYSNTGMYSMDDLMLACVKHGYDACYIDPVIAISKLFGMPLILNNAIPGIDIIMRDMNGDLMSINIERGDTYNEC